MAENLNAETISANEIETNNKENEKINAQEIYRYRLTAQNIKLESWFLSDNAKDIHEFYKSKPLDNNLCKVFEIITEFPEAQIKHSCFQEEFKLKVDFTDLSRLEAFSKRLQECNINFDNSNIKQSFRYKVTLGIETDISTLIIFNDSQAVNLLKSEQSKMKIKKDILAIDKIIEILNIQKTNPLYKDSTVEITVTADTLELKFGVKNVEILNDFVRKYKI